MFSRLYQAVIDMHSFRIFPDSWIYQQQTLTAVHFVQGTPLIDVVSDIYFLKGKNIMVIVENRHTHTHIHTYTHTYTHTRARARARADAHTPYTHNHTQAHTHTRADTHTLTAWLIPDFRKSV